MNDSSNCSASEPFALRVIGDEMMPEFEHDHIIIVDPGGHATSGSYVVAKTDQGLLFRRLLIEGEDFRLVALQDGIEETVLDQGVNDIVGVVSQRSGKRRSDHKRYDKSS